MIIIQDYGFFVRSTYGMSLQMVIMWTCGDVFKTSYFYLRNTPPQFFICGAMQVVDCVKIEFILPPLNFKGDCGSLHSGASLDLQGKH